MSTPSVARKPDGLVVRKLKPEVKEAIRENIRHMGTTVAHGKSQPLEEHVVQMLAYYMFGLVENQWDEFFEEKT